MLYDGEFMREVLDGVLLECTGWMLATCWADWCRIKEKEKGESYDSPLILNI